MQIVANTRELSMSPRVSQWSTDCFTPRRFREPSGDSAEDPEWERCHSKSSMHPMDLLTACAEEEDEEEDEEPSVRSSRPPDIHAQFRRFSSFGSCSSKNGGSTRIMRRETSEQPMMRSNGRPLLFGTNEEAMVNSDDYCFERVVSTISQREDMVSRTACRMSTRDKLNYSAEEYNALLGVAKATEILGMQESRGFCAVERYSVYGAAIAIPQVARSAFWPKTMVFLTMRVYLFLIINFFCQFLLIYYVWDAQSNGNPFGGQMHLCDFGAHSEYCPGGQNCVGPGGQLISSPGDLYPFDVWYTRKYFVQSLQTLFPEKAAEIANVDPGEYGVESYYCRMMCILVFMIEIAAEFWSIYDLGRLLYHLPSRAEPWVQYDPPTWGEKDYVKQVHGLTELSLVKFKVAGMPQKWKIANLIILFIPKLMLWKMLSVAGVSFLMETAAMVDMIVSVTAISFIFQIDEMILDRLSSKVTKYILSHLQDYAMFSIKKLEQEEYDDTMAKFEKYEMGMSFSASDWWLFPRRLAAAFVLMAYFVSDYYSEKCTQTDDGSWVSSDMAKPTEPHLKVMCFMFKVCTNEDVPFWSMTQP